VLRLRLLLIRSYPHHPRSNSSSFVQVAHSSPGRSLCACARPVGRDGWPQPSVEFGTWRCNDTRTIRKSRTPRRGVPTIYNNRMRQPIARFFGAATSSSYSSSSSYSACPEVRPYRVSLFGCGLLRNPKTLARRTPYVVPYKKRPLQVKRHGRRKLITPPFSPFPPVQFPLSGLLTSSPTGESRSRINRPTRSPTRRPTQALRFRRFSFSSRERWKRTARTMSGRRGRGRAGGGRGCRRRTPRIFSARW
jgi:hypothetical protein